jgi:hypothetical protein
VGLLVDGLASARHATGSGDACAACCAAVFISHSRAALSSRSSRSAYFVIGCCSVCLLASQVAVANCDIWVWS